MVIKMPTCRECKFYIPIDGAWGDCHGYEVPGDRDVSECPFHVLKVEDEVSHVQVPL
jgi:hypothetical protein